MNKANYDGLLRIIGFLSAAALWGMSVHFTSRGFGFQMGEDTQWIGIVLALVMTAIQIIWNNESRNTNLTIFIVGLCSYAYGIWANVVGIMGLRADGSEGGILALVFPILLGVFVEIVPEPMLVWAITGEWSTGDFFGNLINVHEAAPIKNRQFMPNGKAQNMMPCPKCGVLVQDRNMREHFAKCKKGGNPAPSGKPFPNQFPVA